jgi:hypothetical protein
VSLVLVLCLAGAGLAVWYGTVYAPARQADAMRALLADIGAPPGFGPDGAPIETRGRSPAATDTPDLLEVIVTIQR